MKKIMLLSDLNFPFKRQSLKKDWVKAKNNPKAQVQVCTHESIKDWDCGCSWGCVMCKYSHECNDCGNKLTHDFLPHVHLIIWRAII